MDMQECIENCQQCHDMCLREAMTHCLPAGGAHAEPEHMRLMLGCADICQTAANFMLSNSSQHVAVCAACAEVCDACADSCDQVGDMDDCARMCRRCAQSCQEMAGAWQPHLMGKQAGSNLRQ